MHDFKQQIKFSSIFKSPIIILTYDSLIQPLPSGALRAVPVWEPFPPGGPSCGGFLRLYGGRRGKVVDMFRRKNGVFLTVPFFFAAVKWLKLLTSFVRQRHLGEPQQRKAGQ